MESRKRLLTIWFIVACLVFDFLFFFIDETASLFGYDCTALVGLQESWQQDKIGFFGNMARVLPLPVVWGGYTGLFGFGGTSL